MADTLNFPNLNCVRLDVDVLVCRNISNVRTTNDVAWTSAIVASVSAVDSTNAFRSVCAKSTF